MVAWRIAVQMVWLSCVLGSSTSISCSLCPHGEENVEFGNRQIPHLGSILTGTTIHPTCDQVVQYVLSAGSTTISLETCQILQEQAAYCGCSKSKLPQYSCTLGFEVNQEVTQSIQSPQMTISGVSCSDFVEYLTFLSWEHCYTTAYGQSLLETAEQCGYTTERSTVTTTTTNTTVKSSRITQETTTTTTPTCAMCPDGTFENLAFPNRIVPFFNLDVDNTHPTCQEIANAAAVANPLEISCDVVTAQAGYCGCADPESQNIVGSDMGSDTLLLSPNNICSFCPDGSAPNHLDRMVSSTGDLCSDLYNYMTYLDAEDCNSYRARSIQGLAYVCGCPTVTQPACTLCENGEAPTYPNQIANPDTEETCQEVADMIQAYTAEVCLDAKIAIAVSAARCCPEKPEFPICGIQQRPQMCTHDLLDTVEGVVECECYAFCDDEFVTCHAHPGGLLSFPLCTGQAISGCNRASAYGTRQQPSQSQPSTTPNTSPTSIPSQPTFTIASSSIQASHYCAIQLAILVCIVGLLV